MLTKMSLPQSSGNQSTTLSTSEMIPLLDKKWEQEDFGDGYKSDSSESGSSPFVDSTTLIESTVQDGNSRITPICKWKIY